MAERDRPDQEQGTSSLTDLVAIDTTRVSSLTDATTTPQPDSIEPRPYLEIRPSEAPVDPRAVTRAMERVYALLRRTTQSGLRLPHHCSR